MWFDETAVYPDGLYIALKALCKTFFKRLLSHISTKWSVIGSNVEQSGQIAENEGLYSK